MHRLALLALFTLLGFFLCHSWYGPDIWYHLTWGRSLLAHQELIPHTQTLLAQPIPANTYWLFQILAQLGYQTGGIYLMSAAFAVLWLIIAVLWLHLAQAWLRPILFFAMIILCQLRFEQRPEVLSYLFLLVSIWLLQRRPMGSRPSWPSLAALVVVQALWTSVHSYFALGPFIAAAYALAMLFGSREDRRSGALLFGAAVLGSLLTPFGWTVWENVWAYTQVGTQLRDLNLELFAPRFWPPSWPLSLLAVWILATLALAVRAFWRRANIFAALIALGGAVLSVEATRNVPLVVLLSAPLWRTLPALPEFISRQAQALVVILSATAFCIWQASGGYLRYLGSLGTFGVHLEWSSYPIGVADFLHDFHGRIFCDSYDGGYLEYALPDAKVAGDSYFADADLTHRFFAAIRDPRALIALDQEFHFDVFVINVENLAEIDWALNAPMLTLVYNDSHRAVFARTMPGVMAVDPAKSSYWHGDSLKNPASAFGPMSWAAIARKQHWPAVLMKILHDIEPSPQIPSGILRQVLAYAVAAQDRELVQKSRALLPRLWLSDDEDAKALAELDTQADQCCR